MLIRLATVEHRIPVLGVLAPSERLAELTDRIEAF